MRRIKNRQEYGVDLSKVLKGLRSEIKNPEISDKKTFILKSIHSAIEKPELSES